MEHRDKRREYQVRPLDRDVINHISQDVHISQELAQSLYHRGIQAPKEANIFLDPKLAFLTSPASMIGRTLAAERITHAIRAKKKIVIFGDYDVDGLTSAVILADIIEILGGYVQILVGNRFQGGYGFNEHACQSCLDVQPDIVILCDCGSSDQNRIERIQKQGIDCIVIDHHIVPKEPLGAFAYINPKRSDCEFPFKDLCTAGLVFSLAAALRTELKKDIDLRCWLDLVAIGTIADLVTLVSDNRILVRAGLRFLSTGRVRPGVRALLQRSGFFPGQLIGSKEIAYYIAPRINAPGRMGSPSIAIDLLRSNEVVQAQKLSTEIERLNRQRKIQEKEVSSQVLKAIVKEAGEHPSHGIVAISDHWAPGVLGIIAARLVERFDVPAAVISFQDDDGVGSVRAPQGVDVYQILSSSGSLLEKFGGHSGAGGLRIKRGNLNAFKEIFISLTSAVDMYQQIPWVEREVEACESWLSFEELICLEPFGFGNEAPLFAFRNMEIDRTFVLAQGQHLKLLLRGRHGLVHAFFPNAGAHLDLLRQDKKVGVEQKIDFLGYIEPDVWGGKRSLQIKIKKILT